MRLKDKAIIVTGGTSGIGAAIAAAAIREGAKVLVHGINEEEGRATVEKLGTNAVLCIADLAEDSAPKEIVSAALKAFGKIDGVVNNAAIFGGTNISDQEEEHYRGWGGLLGSPGSDLDNDVNTDALSRRVSTCRLNLVQVRLALTGRIRGS